MVMFDLPVGTKVERKSASDFRNKLLDYGFEMSQFSIYVRRCPSLSQTKTLLSKIEIDVPITGKNSTVENTDNQSKKIKILRGNKTVAQKNEKKQYLLF